MDKKIMFILIAVFVLLGAVLIIGLSVGLTKDSTCGLQQDRDGSSSNQQSESGNYRYAAVTADNKICSSVGTEILARHRGSAVDAAIATLICLGVVNSQHVGVGGGHVMVIYEAPINTTTKTLQSLVARGTAPLWVRPNYFENNPDAMETGPLSISVPCEMKGYRTAWERYGRVPWPVLFHASIELCRSGWEVSDSMAKSIQAELSTIRADPVLREAYIKPDGEPYQAGDLMTAPKLGQTLERLSARPGAFYTGSLAQDIVDDIKDAGGRISMSDLTSTTALWWRPIEASLRNGTYHLYTPPPPSSGATVAFMLKILDHLPWNAADGYETDPTSRADIIHRFLDTWAVGFALRGHAIGDKAFQTRDMIKWLDAFVDDDYTKELADRIRDMDDLSGIPSPSDDLISPGGTTSGRRSREGSMNGGTTHVNVLTPDGSAVSVTSTVGSLFGAKVRGNRTGLIFNNGLSLFDLPSETLQSINYMNSRKRGRSSTAPIIVLDDDGHVALLAGSSGGTRIITATTYVTAHTLLMNTSATYANSQPRVHSEYNSTLYYDEAIGQEILDTLRDLGHDEQKPGADRYPYLGVNQIVDNRACLTCADTCRQPCIEAVSDWRKAGAPDGY